MPKASVAPEELDFVAAVRAAPESDEPRLAYAHWLRARGNARGELIEVQCALARLGSERSTERESLLRRERALVAEHGGEWAQRVGMKRKSLPWTRGFVERLDTTGGVFAKCARRVFDLEPLSRLCLTGVSDEQLAAIAGDERMATLQTLELQNCEVGASLRALLEGDRVRGLSRLGIAYSQAGDTTAGTIASARSLARLEELDLRGTQIGEDGLRWIGHSPTLSLLRSLVFEGDLDEGAAAALFGSPLAQRVERLSLSGGFVLAPGFARPPRLGDRGAALLARSVSPRLAHLVLAAHDLGSSGLEAIVGSLSTLQSLDLRLNPLRPDDLRPLAAAPMPELESLALGQTDIEDDTMDVLAGGTGLVKLSSLTASEGTLGPRGLERLATSGLGARLTTLSLRASRVDAAGIAALAGDGSLLALRRVVLDHCPIGDEGARVLAKASAPSLASLSLYDAAIGDEGALAIAAARGFSALETMDLRKNSIGSAAAIALLEAPWSRWARLDLRDNPLGAGVLAVDAERPLPAAS